MEPQKKDQKPHKKTAGDNQWTSKTGNTRPDDRDRRDGPGGD